MNVGERENCEGSAISPATAPSTAASPQPIASIESTRTPTRAAAAGRSAAARIPRPSFVKRKSAQTRSTETSTTPIIQTYLMANRDAADIERGEAERRLQELEVGAPDPVDDPVDEDEEADRDDDNRDHRAVLHGPDERDLEQCAEREGDREGRGEGHPVRETPLHQLVRDVRREHRELALREVDDVRRAVDEDEREGEGAVHRAEREPLDGVSAQRPCSAGSR